MRNIEKKIRLILFSTIAVGLMLLLVIFLIKLGIIVPLQTPNQPHISLTVGVPFQLSCEEENVSWYSDNPLVSISPSGEVIISEDRQFPDGQGIIQAFTVGSNSPSCSYTFTVVPWATNESKIDITETNSMIEVFGYKFQYPNIRLSTQFLLPSLAVHGNIDGWIYYSKNRKLFKTKTNFENGEKVANLPFWPAKQRLIATPFGYFMRGKQGVFFSEDLVSWGLSLKTKHPAWLLDNMDFWYDKENQKAYIYVSEYSVIEGEEHLLYKGVIDASKNPNWETAFTVHSETSFRKDPKLISQAARHIHLVKVDPYSGDVWFGTGDEDSQAMMRRSIDNGKSFQLMGIGSQEYRTLGIWFTENYVYWNMDKTFPDQMVFRVNRSHLDERGSLTPILKDGKTKPGVDYIVFSENSNNYFPVNQGEKFTETNERPLSEINQVIAVNDAEYDKKELVANLTNGSHWSVFEAKISNGETVTLLTTTSEGFHRYKTRDNLGRVFGIKENNSGSVTVTELLTVHSYDPKTEKARLEAIAQADDGTLYFQSFHSLFGGSVVSGSLLWNSYERVESQKDELELH